MKWKQRQIPRQPKQHRKIAGKLFAAISHYIDSNGGSCEPYIAPFAVFLNEDEYWIVDPAKNFVIVYNFDTSDSGQYTFADTIKAGIYEDLYIDFSKINL